MAKEKEIVNLLESISRGYIEKKIDGKLYAYIVENLIALNRSILKRKFLKFSEFLAQYDSDSQDSELYNDFDLKHKIRELFVSIK